MLRKNVIRPKWAGVSAFATLRRDRLECWSIGVMEYRSIGSFRNQLVEDNSHTAFRLKHAEYSATG